MGLRMRFREWLRPPRQLLTIFLAMMLASASALTWLGWRILEQDRMVEAQRSRERLEHAADRAAAALERALAEIEDRLTEWATRPTTQIRDPAEDGLALIFSSQTMEAFPKSRLLYYPALPQVPEAPASLFASEEKLEFQDNDPSSAAEAYRRLARSNDSSIRAAALVRLGRVLRKSGQAQAALEGLRRGAGLNARRQSTDKP